jgi:hypothetical protein
MKRSIQTKLLALCILLVLLTAISISATYYWLTKHDKHRESQQRIQIAFDIMLNDFTERMQTATAKWKELLARDTTFAMTPSLYNEDETKIANASFISAFLVSLASELKELGQTFSADRVAVYAANKRLLVFSQRDANQEIPGGYVGSQTGQDTYLNMDDPNRVSTFLVVERNPIPDAPLPSGMTPVYAGEVPEHITTSLFQEGQTLGFRIVAPLYQDKSPAGVLVCDIGYTQSMLERYASLSKTAINLFAGRQWSIGTLPAQTQLEPDALNQMTACEDIHSKTDVIAVMFDNQKYYQGRCALKVAQEVIGAITVSLSQDIEKQATQKI